MILKVKSYPCPLILNLVTGWRWVVNYTPLLLYPQKNVPHYPQNGRLNGIQSQSGWFGEEENLLFMLGIEIWIAQVVPLSLYW